MHTRDMFFVLLGALCALLWECWLDYRRQCQDADRK